MATEYSVHDVNFDQVHTKFVVKSFNLKQSL